MKFVKGCIPWNKNKKCPQISSSLQGHKQSPATIEKRRLKVLGNKSRTGMTNSDEWKKIISEKFSGEGNPFYGKKHTTESILKRSGENHVFWRGDDAKSRTIHNWVVRQKGKANHCENCGMNDPDRKYNWSNKDHKYRRVLEDYTSLCQPCHCKYDYKNNLRKPPCCFQVAIR